ncbi:MAG TPA: response regulator [Desulfuromonadales bacterium]|nr:response regulator [Desulfuromonadales bacterium]
MSIKVLVADDSITIQKVIGIIFGGDEYSLTIVDNGKSAVDKAREINPDILLIDVLMPGMSGYEVSELVRSTPALADKPILLLTGSFEPFDEEKAQKCGADDFIAKPFESQQIITKVKELLERGKSRERSAETVSPPPSADIFSEQPVEETPPSLDMPSPLIEQQPAAPVNIWSAFTPEAETQDEAEVTPAFSAVSAEACEPDVFALVNEENDAQVVAASVTADVPPQLTGSEWVPIEEQLFEFVEEAAAPPPLPDFSVNSLPVEEDVFGEIAFASEEKRSPEPVFAAFTASSALPEVPAAPFAPLSDPVPASAAIPSGDLAPAETIPAAIPASLTEEQLRAAIAGASKEVIERIVWEVVPDLAEALIREAIRKITQGS